MLIIFLLLVTYQIKHFLADFPLQTQYMLGKFKPGKAYIAPLLMHVGVHGALTFAIAYVFVGNWWLPTAVSALDMTVHFIMDRIKASPNYLGRYKPLTDESFPKSNSEQKKNNKYFWWSLGLDQMVHHLTHYLIIYILIASQ